MSLLKLASKFEELCKVSGRKQLSPLVTVPDDFEEVLQHHKRNMGKQDFTHTLHQLKNLAVGHDPENIAPNYPDWRSEDFRKLVSELEKNTPKKKSPFSDIPDDEYEDFLQQGAFKEFPEEYLEDDNDANDNKIIHRGYELISNRTSHRGAPMYECGIYKNGKLLDVAHGKTRAAAIGKAKAMIDARLDQNKLLNNEVPKG